ncbi:MAG: TRAP transporter substrate-binding protein DctP [Thermodesulfobacteriota bacterium]
MHPIRRSLCLLLCLLLLPASALATPRHLLKIATLAPEGSVWAKRFQEFQNEVRAKSNGEIDFKLYMGGVMGDDRAMYRKMRVGQLQGGGFTMTGIAEVVPDFRIMGAPFLFTSYAEVDRVREGLLPLFKKAFTDKELTLLAITEVGFIHPMSTRPVSTLTQLRSAKCWAPENDPLGRSFLEDIGVTPIPLSIPDVLSGLSTGMIDTVFNSFYGAIVLQWFTKTPYVIEVPYGYAYGGLIFAKGALDKLSPEQRAMMEESAQRHFSALLADTRRSNEEALATLRKSGAQLVAADEESLRQLRATRDKTVQRLIGNAYSKEIHDATMRLLAESRRGGTGR